MSRRGSSTEQLQENRSNLFSGKVSTPSFLGNFLNNYDGVSFKDFLPAPLRIGYDINQGQIPYQEELTSMFSFLNKDGKDGKDGKDEKEDERKYLEENKELLGEISTLAEQARDRAALRTGISNLALSPLLGGQAAMDAAANISKLTGVNMAAIASQGNVMAGNPTKQKIAGKYFR